MTWRDRLAAMRAEGRGPTPLEVAEAKAWATCAVGEQHAAHPTVVVYQFDRVQKTDVPEDAHLSLLGSAFYSMIFTAAHNQGLIEKKCLIHAEDILDRIEDHVLAMKRTTA
jgi:hypothetical protein